MTYYELRRHLLRAAWVLVNALIVVGAVFFAALSLIDGLLQRIG